MLVMARNGIIFVAYHCCVESNMAQMTLIYNPLFKYRYTKYHDAVYIMLHVSTKWYRHNL